MLAQDDQTGDGIYIIDLHHNLWHGQLVNGTVADLIVVKENVYDVVMPVRSII